MARKTGANVRHSSENPRWGSPEVIVEIGRKVLGRYTVDPFTELRFNQIVKAERILTGSPGLDGFHEPWILGAPRADHVLARFPSVVPAPNIQMNTALVNPPGDDSGENVKRAWELLDTYHHLGWLGGGALWVGFNLNQLQTVQGVSARTPLSADFLGCRCIPGRRHAFTPAEITDERAQPSHPCWFVLLPSRDDDVAKRQIAEFTRLSRALGDVF